MVLASQMELVGVQVCHHLALADEVVVEQEPEQVVVQVARLLVDDDGDAGQVASSVDKGASDPRPPESTPLTAYLACYRQRSPVNPATCSVRQSRTPESPSCPS